LVAALLRCVSWWIKLCWNTYEKRFRRVKQDELGSLRSSPRKRGENTAMLENDEIMGDLVLSNVKEEKWGSGARQKLFQ